MNHFVVERYQHVGDDSPMTSPPKQFSAHYCRPQTSGQHEEICGTFGEFFRCSMICVASKRRVGPAAVWRIGFGLATPAKRSEPFVANPRVFECFLQLGRVEVRQSARRGKSSNIRYQLHVVGGEDGNKLFEGPGRVTNSSNRIVRTYHLRSSSGEVSGLRWQSKFSSVQGGLLTYSPCRVSPILPE